MTDQGIYREWDGSGLWADDTDFADLLEEIVDPVVYASLIRIYDRYFAAMPKQKSLETLFTVLIIYGVERLSAELEPLEKALGIT